MLHGLLLHDCFSFILKISEAIVLAGIVFLQYLLVQYCQTRDLLGSILKMRMVSMIVYVLM